MANSMKESGVQKAVLDLLAAHRILAFRMNTGVARYLGGNGKERLVKYGSVGMADVLASVWLDCTCRDSGSCCKRATYVWIECKAPGGKQRPEQESFQKIVEADGHRYLVVDNPDILIKWLKGNNVR